MDTAIPLLMEALRKTWIHESYLCGVCSGTVGYGHESGCIVLQCDWWPEFVAAHPEWA